MSSPMSICILGRQPALGLAELESLYGAECLQTLGHQAALLQLDPAQLAFSRLGGTIKVGKLLHRFTSTDWRAIEKYLTDTLPAHLDLLPEGKLTLGLSVYDLPVKPKQIEATALSLKKIIKKTGRPARIIPNKTAVLSTPQVLHNKLSTPLGWELFFIRDGNDVLMAQTTYIQDIDAYTARDQARPKRDSKVGMLPPKLAQIIINLATGSAVSKDTTILDPFCGTGVVLQEASLMGLGAYGTDLEPRMIDYTNANLAWLSERSGHHIQGTTQVADATMHTWSEHPFDHIAGETYLGRPFSTSPDPATLREVMQDVNHIHKKFLQNVARQAKPGFRMTIAVPAWFVRGTIQHLKTLDSLEELGYTRVSFVHAADKDLIYHREGQIVGRELVTLIRK